MRKLFILLILITLITDVSGQFRKRKNQPKRSSTTELNYANPAKYTIAGIEVEGLNVLDKNAIISLTGLKIGDEIKVPGDEITGAIRKLWKHGLVGDVTITAEKIEGSQIYLIVKLAERPRLTNYYFTGISKGRQSSLKEDIDLIKGKIVNDAMLEILN
jgi:outer membrane protein insertion porin family